MVGGLVEVKEVGLAQDLAARRAGEEVAPGGEGGVHGRRYFGLGRGRGLIVRHIGRQRNRLRYCRRRWGDGRVCGSILLVCAGGGGEETAEIGSNGKGERFAGFWSKGGGRWRGGERGDLPPLWRGLLLVCIGVWCWREAAAAEVENEEEEEGEEAVEE